MRGEVERASDGAVPGWDLRWTHRPLADRRPPVAASLSLRQHPTIPRPAGYAINGHGVDRTIALPDYAISFAARSSDPLRTVPVRDPLATSVEAFVRGIEAGDVSNETAVVDGMTHLQALVAAAAQKETA